VSIMQGANPIYSARGRHFRVNSAIYYVWYGPRSLRFGDCPPVKHMLAGMRAHRATRQMEGDTIEQLGRPCDGGISSIPAKARCERASPLANISMNRKSCLRLNFAVLALLQRVLAFGATHFWGSVQPASHEPSIRLHQFS
jgi:hypothetical protein